MTALQIISIVVSSVCAVIMVILAWVVIYRVNRTEVTFTGNPVDKKEYDRFVEERRTDSFKIWQKMEMDRNDWKDAVGEIKADIGGLKKETEICNQRSFNMDGKIDRLLSRKL